MNPASDFDLGPLTWVKGEIDAALDRAAEALGQSSADPTQLRFCRTYIHQVHGALAIVGLDGVTQVTESLEGLLQAIEDNRIAAVPDALAIVSDTLDALRHYLDDLMAGEPNQPLRLFPAYNALSVARTGEPAQATDLFHPDLGQRPPRRGAGQAPAGEDLQAVVKAERARFQKGLLAWLKKPEAAAEGLEQMCTALARIEATQDSPAARAFWWVSQGFLQAAASRGAPPDPEARQLCTRIDLQIRRLLEGSRNVAERLMRDVLYQIARTPEAAGGEVDAIRASYRLDRLIPAADAAASAAPQHARLRRLRDTAAAAEELWNKFCAGSVGVLGAFAEQARLCTAITAEIGQTDVKRLGQGLGAMANWLVEDPARHNEMVGMEVATAILLLQNAQENFRRLGTDFAQQVDLMVARLHGCIAGKPADQGKGLPVLDEMARRAQEKLLVGQVAREIQSNLAQIEQALDAFFRDPERNQELAQLEAPLRQVAGAFNILGQGSALKVIDDARAQVRRFSQPGYAPAAGDFEALAQQLSVLGFFVDSLQDDGADFDTFARRLQGEPENAAEEFPAEAAPPAPTVERELERQKKDAQALAEALKEKPEDPRLKVELKQSLQALQKDADLVADPQLAETAKAALSALDADHAEAPAALDAALTSLAPPPAEDIAPSAETIQLAQASGEEIDAELLSIFLEEAREVLATMADNLGMLDADPHNNEALTTLRRATHTLKGSGRMVGLAELGEVAWAVEQTLNLWLRQEMAVTPELLDLLGLEHEVFAAWVHHLEDRRSPLPDPSALVARAEALRAAEPLPVPEPAPVPPPSAVSAPSAQIIELPIARPSRPAPAELVDLPEPVQKPEPLPEPEPFEFTLDDLSTPAEEVSEAAAMEEFQALDLGNLPELTEVDAEAVPVPEPSEPPPPAPPSPTLYDIFREEAKGHLATLSAGFGEMERQPAAPVAFEMTRAAHTLGGIAATVGIAPINRLAIALEHALLRKDGSVRPDGIEGLETVRQALLGLEDMFAALAAQRQPDPLPALVEALEAIYPPAEPVESLVAEPGAEVVTTGAPQDAPAPDLPRLKDEFDDHLLPLFLEEAQDLFRGFGEQLRAWRAAPEEAAPARALSRLLHTFKGSARMAGAMNLGEATHALESRIEDILQAGEPRPGQIEEIESGVDGLVQQVERLQEGSSGEDVPVLDEVVESPASPPVDAEAEASAQRTTLRVRADVLDRLVNEAGELSIARARIEGEMRGLKGSLLELTENVIRLRRQLREIEIQAETQMQAQVAQSPADTHFDPLELDRFTRFQELTRFMAESVNDVATLQQNLLKNLDDANAAILAQARLNRSLQQELMAVRMVPFDSQADRLYRIVRQTTRETGKRANLDIRGGQVEIDRSILDKMLAPLEHMLRNAISHGIEPRDERARKGKPEIGEISLSLQQEGNEIILSMADDGAGLDPQRIRARAESQGLLAPGEDASEARIFDLIFQPGFSTATELTQVSGRGVGMDVVKNEVAGLGGRIEIQSSPSQGTTFRLYLPLTLAVTQTLIVRVGSRRYAIPSTMIEQVQELKEKALRGFQERGAIEWMGNRYPLHFLPQLLGDPEALPETRRHYWVLFLRSGTQRVAVQVDELQGNQEVVVKNIGPQLARVVGIAGATVLGDGEVVLILNPVALAGRAPRTAASRRAAAPAPAAPLPAATLPTVMVVDDSLTVRKITGRLLAREGYQVVTAKDGVDALEQLVDILPDVVLSDIEMPRMDGFDLLRSIRADERLRTLPVIMITSRTADKHRNYALELGADHYLGKPYDEDQLLGLVAGYVKARRGG